MYEMFLGPIEQDKPWNTEGISGVHNFLKKFWRLFYQEDHFLVNDQVASAESLKVVHQTIKKVTEDIERLSFNTCVSRFMICINELTALKCSNREVLEPLLVLLSPFAPHFTEELWMRIGNTNSIAFEPFPKFDPSKLEEKVRYDKNMLSFTIFNNAMSTRQVQDLSESQRKSLESLLESILKF